MRENCDRRDYQGRHLDETPLVERREIDPKKTVAVWGSSGFDEEIKNSSIIYMM